MANWTKDDVNARIEQSAAAAAAGRQQAAAAPTLAGEGAKGAMTAPRGGIAGGAKDEAYKKANGGELVAARQYANDSGIQANVEWDSAEGVVNVGGKRIKPEYVSDDGIAMVDRNDMDRALTEQKNNTGQLLPKDVVSAYNTRYDAKREAALSKLINRDKFSYDENKDPVYQAYANMYHREGDLAYRKAMDAATRGNGANIGTANGAELAKRAAEDI